MCRDGKDLRLIGRGSLADGTRCRASIFSSWLPEISRILQRYIRGTPAAKRAGSILTCVTFGADVYLVDSAGVFSGIALIAGLSSPCV